MIHSANGSFDGLSYRKTCRYYKVFERIDLQPGLFVMPFVKAISAPLSRFLILLAPLVLSAAPAFAQTKEAAIKNCRMKVGRPIVMACMRGGGNLEGCREKAKPQVVACVVAAPNAANGRANVAVALPTEVAPKLAPGTALPA